MLPSCRAGAAGGDEFAEVQGQFRVGIRV